MFHIILLQLEEIPCFYRTCQCHTCHVAGVQTAVEVCRDDRAVCQEKSLRQHSGIHGATRKLASVNLLTAKKKRTSIYAHPTTLVQFLCICIQFHFLFHVFLCISQFSHGNRRTTPPQCHPRRKSPASVPATSPDLATTDITEHRSTWLPFVELGEI